MDQSVWSDRVASLELLRFSGRRDISSVLVSESVRILEFLLERYTMVNVGCTRLMDRLGVLEGSLPGGGYYSMVGSKYYLLVPSGGIQGDMLWDSYYIPGDSIRGMLGSRHCQYLSGERENPDPLGSGMRATHHPWDSMYFLMVSVEACPVDATK